VFRQIGEQMFEGLNEEDLQNLGQLLNRLKENLSNMDKPGAGEGNACPDERS